MPAKAGKKRRANCIPQSGIGKKKLPQSGEKRGRFSRQSRAEKEFDAVFSPLGYPLGQTLFPALREVGAIGFLAGNDSFATWIRHWLLCCLRRRLGSTVIFLLLATVATDINARNFN